MENQPQHSVQEDFTLTPLTPEFNEDNHRSYVKRINSALQNQKIRKSETLRYLVPMGSVKAVFCKK
tara:strand:+ start:472 stop:669 length:198 start_codon:yes stop_codon:yes gene_type:complete